VSVVESVYGRPMGCVDAAFKLTWCGSSPGACAITRAVGGGIQLDGADPFAEGVMNPVIRAGDIRYDGAGCVDVVVATHWEHAPRDQATAGQPPDIKAGRLTALRSATGHS